MMLSALAAVLTPTVEVTYDRSGHSVNTTRSLVSRAQSHK